MTANRAPSIRSRRPAPAPAPKAATSWTHNKSNILYTHPYLSQLFLNVHTTLQLPLKLLE